MLIILRKRCAQGTLEYALLIGAVVAALVAMNIYMRRGFQGRIKSSSDSIGSQYDVQRTTSDFTTTSYTDTTDTAKHAGTGGTSNFSTNYNTDVTTKTGSERIRAPR